MLDLFNNQVSVNHLQTQIPRDTDLEGIPDLGAQEGPEQPQVLAPLPGAATPLVGNDV
jgi:hypothetical protein